MLHRIVISLSLLLSLPAAYGKVVIFWQEGFPTIDSQPVAKQTLAEACRAEDPIFAGIADLKKADTLNNADLLILPYGSAIPADIWKTIRDYLDGGGNLLTLGGRALFVPVSEANARRSLQG